MDIWQRTGGNVVTCIVLRIACIKDEYYQLLYPSALTAIMLFSQLLRICWWCGCMRGTLDPCVHPSVPIFEKIEHGDIPSVPGRCWTDNQRGGPRRCLQNAQRKQIRWPLSTCYRPRWFTAAGPVIRDFVAVRESRTTLVQLPEQSPAPFLNFVVKLLVVGVGEFAWDFPQFGEDRWAESPSVHGHCYDDQTNIAAVSGGCVHKHDTSPGVRGRGKSL